MPYEPLEPARIHFDAGGTPYSQDFADVYHSVDGGPAQAREVFLRGNGLPERWRGRERFMILETGFGLGLNFLACAAELLADPAAPRRLHYVAVEKHPASAEDLARAHATWPQYGALAQELRSRMPPPLRGFHRIELASGRIALTLLLGDAERMLAELEARVDAVFLDGFAPSKNPAMWSDAVIGELARLSAPGATAATWSVAAELRARLQQAGFHVEKRPGFGRKREMLAAVRAATAAATTAAFERRRDAVIVGAGLAACWMAHALAQRGWNATLLERNREPALEGSGNPVSAVRPAINLADSVNAQLARAAFLRTVAVLAHDAAYEDAFGQTGVLHVATSPLRAQRMSAITQAHPFPERYVRWVETREAARIAGRPVAGPAWWIADGGWVRPAALCAALLAQAGERVRTRFGAGGQSIVRTACGWRACDADGQTLAEAPVVIVANGLGARQLRLPGTPRLIGVRGQVSVLPPASARALGIVVGGDGYVAPLPGGGHCVGATFEPNVESDELRMEDHRSNLARAERMLPGFAARLGPDGVTGWAGIRAATSDRLPACGALETDERAAGPDCYLLTGLGARGLIWAPLCAEVLASRLEREPNPVERSLVAAMDPLRAGLRSGEL